MSYVIGYLIVSTLGSILIGKCIAFGTGSDITYEPVKAEVVDISKYRS